VAAVHDDARGILAEDARVELIEGGLSDMPPIGGDHMSDSSLHYELALPRGGAARRAAWPTTG
jgi:hypothetical protein